MIATLVDPVVYFVILIGVDLFLGALIGSGAFILALILADHYVLFSVSSAGNTRECVDINQLG
jgi:hypothetical protein